MSPPTFGSLWNADSASFVLDLFLVLIGFRMNDPVAKNSRGQITFPRLFEKRSSLGTDARNRPRCACLVFECQGRDFGSRHLPVTEDWRAPWFAESVGSQIDVEIMPSNGNIDDICGNLRCSYLKGR